MSFVIIGWIISILSQELLYMICIVYCIYDIYVFFFSVREYFIFKYIKYFLNSSVSLPRQRHTQGVYTLETILKWEDSIKKNCLFLGELTIKCSNAAQLFGWVCAISYTVLQEMFMK